MLENSKAINENDLDRVNGGRILNATGMAGCDINNPWEIVDKMIIDAISNYTRPYGFVPKLRFVKNHESTVTCVRNNMGVMIADDWVWAKNADDLRWIPFNAQDSISIARLKTRGSDDVLAMEEILLDILKNHKSA